MPLRVVNQLSVVVWNSANQTKRRFEGGEGFVSNAFNKHLSKDVVVPAAAVGPPVVPAVEVVSLDDFGASPDHARGLYVQADRGVELLVTFDSTEVTVPLVRPGPVGTPTQLYLDGSPTALRIQNSDASGAAVCTVALWGSETPA